MKTKPGIKCFDKKRVWKAFVLGSAVVAMVAMFTGCCDECQDPVIIDNPPVDYPPAAPTGVFSITGDGWVDIYWNANTERDLEGYDIYWSDSEESPFKYMVSVPRHSTHYVDYDVDNGVTYFYLLRAYDAAGQQSGDSGVIFDTPRPAGTNLFLYDYLGQNTGSSGYDFSEYTVQAWDRTTTDVYFGSPNGVPTLFGRGSSVGRGVDVQDYGYIDLDFVDWAPDITEGWSPSKRVEMIPGHSYVVQMLDVSGYYFYAKVFCQTLGGGLVVLDWAYQIDPGNPELSPEQGDKR
jgi:hypothetical protein